MGFWVGLLSFFLAEGIVARTNQRKESIRRRYLDRVSESISSKLKNLVIQDPPDKIISMEYYNAKESIAYRVKIESFQDSKLLSRTDAQTMGWNGKNWVISSGYQRFFNGDQEKAVVLNQPIETSLHFTPKELLLAQVKPDEMNYLELQHFIDRLRQSRASTKRWLTDLYFRVSFPMSNVIIVFLSVPLVYNLRKKSLAAGFGISLLICFLFFGLVKLGQTLGNNTAVHPLLAAWMGNVVASISGLVNIMMVRK